MSAPLPAEPGEGEGLEAYRALVAAVRPDLAHAPIRLLAAGWDCVGLDVDDRLIVKVPRDAEAAGALAREARLMALVRPRVTLPLPDLRLAAEPRVHSWHAKLPGAHLLPADYEALPEAARERLARDLARVMAELHAIPLEEARAAGAQPEAPWPPLDAVAALALPLLPEGLRAEGRAALDAFARLGPDPLGEVLGHFDAHGWNMAWDGGARRLNGLFDFGDAGIGGRHAEFVAPGLVAPDLAGRVVAAYRAGTGLPVDARRVTILSAAWRLRELAEEAAADPQPFTLDQAERWVRLAARAPQDSQPIPSPSRSRWGP